MKKKTNKKAAKKKLPRLPLVVLAIIITCFVLVETIHRSKQKSSGEIVMENTQVVWKSHQLDDIYPVGSATNDIVKDTLDKLEQFHAFVAREIPNDSNLQRLCVNEKASAVSAHQFDDDLKKLKGLELGFIGQFHESLDSEEFPIIEVQSNIARMVREKYDVLWTEDFTGGTVITADNCWQQLTEESLDSDIPIIRQMSDPVSTKEYMLRCVAMHASHQLIFDPKSKIEVRGADYRPVKSIQQHFMEYELPMNIRGPVPITLSEEQKKFIVNVLSDARDLYILRNIALHADHTKRNVLVLGAFHSNHIAYLLAKYGVKCSLVIPEKKK